MNSLILCTENLKSPEISKKDLIQKLRGCDFVTLCFMNSLISGIEDWKSLEISKKKSRI